MTPLKLSSDKSSIIFRRMEYALKGIIRLFDGSGLINIRIKTHALKIFESK